MLVYMRDYKLTSFKSYQEKQLDVFSCMECCEMLKPDNLEHLITQVPRHEYITKRLKAIYGCNGGIPLTHHPFWEGVGVELQSS